MQLSKKPNKIKGGKWTSKTLLRFLIKGLEGILPWLMRSQEDRFWIHEYSNQQRINTRTPRLGRQMLALRSLVTKRKRQARTSVYHTLSSRKRISVNVVSNESTPSLIGLDVLREDGFVIDYHYNRLQSNSSDKFFFKWTR